MFNNVAIRNSYFNLVILYCLFDESSESIIFYAKFSLYNESNTLFHRNIWHKRKNSCISARDPINAVTVLRGRVNVPSERPQKKTYFLSGNHVRQWGLTFPSISRSHGAKCGAWPQGFTGAESSKKRKSFVWCQSYRWRYFVLMYYFFLKIFLEVVKNGLLIRSRNHPQNRRSLLVVFGHKITFESHYLYFLASFVSRKWDWGDSRNNFCSFNFFSFCYILIITILTFNNQNCCLSNINYKQHNNLIDFFNKEW